MLPQLASFFDLRKWRTYKLNLSIEISELAVENQNIFDQMKTKFELMSKDISSSVGHILGTGPNVMKVQEQSYSASGVTSIVCNSAVKNKQLLKKFKPKIIVASDPIFHAGCSSYAGEFRNHLIHAIDEYGSYFVVPIRDYVIYSKNLPDRFREKIIGIPVKENNNIPNLNLHKNFFVTKTENVLTLLLFPLACTLFEEVHIAGFDGKPLANNDYFWKHDPDSQINHQMEKIKEAHPSFFNISYDDYYETHINTVDRWISAAHKINKTLVNRTNSFIPALQNLYQNKVDVIKQRPDFDGIPV